MTHMQMWSWQVIGWELPTAHNGWIDQALTFGLPALALYFGFWRMFFNITDSAVGGNGLDPAQVILDGLRCSILALVGVYFFEPVDYVTFPISQLFFLMGLGVCTASIINQAPRHA